MANPSLSEYLSQSEQGMMSNVFGPDYLKKQSYFTVDTATGIFNATYGKKVWQGLNNQTRFFNAIPRTVWGSSAGWRVRTDRGSQRSRPVTETGSLPTVDISNIETISSLPRIVGTTFGASVKSIFSSGLEGGVGDVLALEAEQASTDHAKEINEELLASSSMITSAGATTTFTVPASMAKNFKIGDSIAQYDVSATGHDRQTGSVVSAVNESTGVVTVATGTTFADGDIAYIFSRAGLTSIDDLVMRDGAEVGNQTSRVRAYDLSINTRTAGGWSAGASVSYNGGTGRALTLQLIDNAIQAIRENGGNPNLIVCGHDQYYALERLLNTNQRYMGVEEVVVGVGQEKTFPGTRTGLTLATYQGIPIIPDADVAKSVATNDAVLGSNLYVLDTSALEVAVAQPTTYVENRDFYAANSLVVRGLIYTMAELRCYNMAIQAKVADLN